MKFLDRYWKLTVSLLLLVHFSINLTNNFHRNIPTRRYRSELSPFDEIANRQGQVIMFTTAKNPDKEYRIVIQNDFVERGIFSTEDLKSKHMIHIMPNSNNDTDNRYPVAMTTGIHMTEDGILNIGWEITLDYSGIYEAISPYRKDHMGEKSLLAAMVAYFTIGPKDEFNAQAKFLYAYFTSVLNIENDSAIKEFFQSAPSNLRGQGIGTAMTEFITSFIPIGGKIQFKLANQESLDALARGENFEDTLYGSLYRNLGFEIFKKLATEEDYPTYILERRNLTYPASNWVTPKSLGMHILTNRNPL
ncbi:MAG: hypothetical protein P9X27_03705 [Candidatus Kaelpia aquatica]|nr:hypothetical protein [Candidatus Kaelpia aquatica]